MLLPFTISQFLHWNAFYTEASGCRQLCRTHTIGTVRTVRHKKTPVHLKVLCQSLSRPPTMPGNLKVLIIHEGHTSAPLPAACSAPEDQSRTTVSNDFVSLLSLEFLPFGKCWWYKRCAFTQFNQDYEVLTVPQKHGSHFSSATGEICSCLSLRVEFGALEDASPGARVLSDSTLPLQTGPHSN